MSLVETLVAASLFTLLSLAMAFALKQSSQLWVSNSSHQEAAQTLRKAAVKLERELSMASVDRLAVDTVPASLSPGGYDGDAVWFLSHINPHDGEAYLKSDGTPFWQCNVLYYSVVPRNVNQLSGRPVTGGSSPDGYEDRCPHKVLVRKVIDVGAPTDTNDEDSEEALLTDPTAFLTRPASLNLAAMQSEPEVIRAEVVTTDLLYFRAVRNVPLSGVEFDLRVLSQGEAQKVARSTSESLLESPFVLQNRLFVNARN